MTGTGIYLDYAATSPVDPAVAKVMTACLELDGVFANPSSDHVAGTRAMKIVEQARCQVAQRVGAHEDSIVFTSGATEANNLALQGMFPWHTRERAHLVTSRIEHRSVLDVARHLASNGVSVSYVDCDQRGIVDPEAVAAAIRDDTRLVSIMYVNNEIGSVQDIGAIAAQCRARNVPFHIDAAQGAGKLPLDLSDLGVDMCSLTAHKLCGPKGIGALYVRDGLRLDPLMHGGEQERGIRPGTLATHQIAGMGQAYELADDKVESARIADLRDMLWQALSIITDTSRNGDSELVAPHILNVSFPGVDGESLRCALGDLAVSQGSACASDRPEASYVLTALGLSDARAQSSLRFGLGRFTTRQEIELAARRVKVAVERLRRLSEGAPAWCSA
jgi:cysteine desulfurase